VTPTCRHLGCQVTFNTAERTWDCPCHGSRYDVDGRVIEGPTVKDLEPVASDGARGTGDTGDTGDSGDTGRPGEAADPGTSG
jgi:Rieske Fe-S protein